MNAPVFTDLGSVPNSASAIEHIHQHGWVAGRSTDPPLYAPVDAITRAEFAVLAMRAAYGLDYIPPAGVGDIPDVPLDHWGVDWIEAAINTMTLDLLPDGTFNPEGSPTRADAAVLIADLH